MRHVAYITPALSFADIFGTECVYNARRPQCDNGPPQAPPFFDAGTGHVVGMAGAMPILCPRACASRTVFRLLERAGNRDLPPMVLYGSADEFRQRLARLAQTRTRVVFQYVRGAESFPESLYWIDPRVPNTLNDKAQLPELVPARYVPPRTTIPTAELDRLLAADFSTPLVLKATGPWDQGNASAVAIVRDPSELVAACERIGRGPQVVQEKFLDVVRNYCVTFAAGACGIRYLGTTDQITDPQGHHLGSWVDAESQPPAEAVEVGHEIMRRAVARGYVGLAGFDVVVDRDGRLWVIDLNFRLNSSTGANLWRSVLQARGPHCRVAKTAVWKFPAPLAAAEPLLNELIDQGVLFPLKLFDPFSTGETGEPSHVTGLLFGHSREDVESKQQRITASLPAGGLTTADLPRRAA